MLAKLPSPPKEAPPQGRVVTALSPSKKIWELLVSGVDNRNPELTGNPNVQGVRFAAEEPFLLAKWNPPFSLTPLLPLLTGG